MSTSDAASISSERSVGAPLTSSGQNFTRVLDEKGKELVKSNRYVYTCNHCQDWLGRQLKIIC